MATLNDLADTPNRDVKTAGGMAAELAGLYGIWWLAALAIQMAGIPLKEGGSPFGSAAAVLASVWVASQMTARFAVHIAPWLQQDRSRQRIGLIAGTLGTALLFWYWQRFGGGVPPLVAPLYSANLLVFACLAGTWLTKGLRRPAELVPVGVLMALVDSVSALAGPTRRIAESLETYYKGGMAGPLPAGDFLLIKSAFWGSDRLMPIFGVSDWVMVAFLTAAAVKFDLNDNLAGKPLAAMIRRGRTALFFPVAAGGVALAVWTAQFSGRAGPALPLVALAHLGWCLLRFPQTRRLTAGDRGILLGLLGAAALGWTAARLF